MSTHKVHSPSSAARRRLCPGSLAACKDEPNVNTKFAAEGSAYHFVATSVLERIADPSRGAGNVQGTECADWVGLYVHVTPEICYAGLPTKQPGDEFVFQITEEDAAYAQVYVDAMLARKRGNTSQFYEVKVNTSRVIGIPDQGGTGDCVTLDFDNLTIYIDDLKFGKGKPVSAFWEADGKKMPNDQCAEYGAGVLDMFRLVAPWERVVVGIHQPRIQGAECYTELEMTVEELDAWVRDTCRPYEQKAHKLYASGTPEDILANLKPSVEGCKFCPLDGRCVAQIRDALAAYPAIEAPDGLNKAKTAMWVATDEEFLKVLELADRYSDFWGAVWGEGLRRIESGGKLPGWKLVTGRKGHRTLNLDAQIPTLDGSDATTAKSLVDAMVGEDAYEPAEIKSASKLDTLLNKKRHPEYEIRKAVWTALQGAITQPEGKPQLAREGDTRPAMARISGADEFAIIDTNQ
jgi:hypothetical protein